MSPRVSAASKAFITALFCAALLSCNVGQGIKTLGKKALGGTGTPTTDADAFSVTLAYRNPIDLTAAARRVVSIQGLRGIPSANLVNECGTTGSQCTCDFYRSSSDLAPIVATTVGISAQNNSFSCTIPSSVSDTDVDGNLINFVRIRRTDVANKNTGLIEVKRTLTIEDVLGSSLVKTKVRGVFKYNCNRTFFEGEGVEAGRIVCSGGQHLGVIGATYNFYTFKSGEDSNEAGGDSAFDEAICKRNSFLKIQCTGNTPQLQFGLYKDGAEPFTVNITLTRAPEGENLSASYGFAAVPDSAGNCPTGLIKVRPWVAQPASIVPTLDLSQCPTPGACPSNFINTGNALNNKVVEQLQPSPFIVTRSPNQTPCASDGDCNSASFAGQQNVQTVAYVPLTPIICAIPSNLLSGLF